MRDTDKTAEEQYLQNTLQIIEKNLQEYGRESSRMQSEIDEMLEHYHDNDVELWTLLNNTITLNEHMKRALQRNEKALEKPYFGRIIFRDEELGKTESLYIGKGGISIDRTSQAVVDWRAPVANAYYENGLGKCSYKAPDDKEIEIELQLKRTFEIESGKLLDYYDTEVVANDDLLMKYLSKNKEAVLGEIVATIQKEQNEIIRKTPYHNMIVQGVAGSGKTTVAMHRISYILYNYKERFRPEDFYIVGSNRILLNYITGVLPDLDVHGVRQMTMEQLFTRLLYEDWDEKKYKIRELSDSRDIVKGTEKWFYELTAFIRRLENKLISTESVFLNPRQFVEGIVNGKSGIYDKRDEDKAAGIPVKPVLLVDGAAVLRYVSQNPTVSIQSKINMLNDRLMIKIKDEFLGKIKYTEEEKKAILREYRNYYGNKNTVPGIYDLYQSFLSEQLEKGYDIICPTESFDVYDLAALALLYKWVRETEIISEAHHIVIDEAQDFGMMAYHVLHACIKECTYTVMGDVSQNIHFGYGLSDWEQLKALLLSDSMDYFGTLKKSYRNTVEISDFATRILRHGNFPIYPVEPIIRHGSPVTVAQISGSSVEFAKHAARLCESWQKCGYQTIAVVCRNEIQAKKVSDALAKHIAIMESDLEKANFGNGILVLPVAYTKGLEFDAVLIWDPTKEDYPWDDGHARLLYVASTRALHELTVLYRGELTELISEPVPASGLLKMEQENILPAEEKTEETTKEKAEQKAEQKTEQRTEEKAQQKRPISSSRNRVKIVLSKPDESRQERVLKSKPLPEPKEQNIGEKPHPQAPQFGDMPATEKLRPVGHAKINSAIRWVSKQTDGLYLQSQYGILRMSPVGSGIIRLTFGRGTKLTDGKHPLIATNHVEKNWKYRDSGKTIQFSTAEILVSADKATGSLQFADTSGKILLSERKNESRKSEQKQSWWFAEFDKKEQLYAMNGAGKGALKLRGSARYISSPQDKTLPLILSDKGYGIVPACDRECIFCDITAYGSYVYMNAEQTDFYFIAGKQQQTILNAYSYLLGLL